MRRLRKSEIYELRVRECYEWDQVTIGKVGLVFFFIKVILILISNNLEGLSLLRLIVDEICCIFPDYDRFLD